MKMSLLLIGCVLFFYTYLAQSKSRVVFYYKSIFSLPYNVGKGLIPVYWSPTNSDTVIKIKKTFIWDTEDPNGIYSFVTTGDHPALETKLDAPHNSISFIEMRQRYFWPMPKLRKSSYADFKKVYDTQKKYRKRLADAGFSSAEELVKGYMVN